MSRNFNNKNDSMDVNELNSLNNDISEKNIEQLQQQLMSNISSDNDVEDEYLFEETESDDDNDKLIKDTSFDDPFARKYALKQKQTRLQAKNQVADNKDTNIISNDDVNNDSDNNALSSTIQNQTDGTVQQSAIEPILSDETQNTDTTNNATIKEQPTVNKQPKEKYGQRV